uniref:Uncharacterized protein n=1 Tax=Anguilla anguilla TaxID=7936 RepID=A0A0E9SDE5_ANGAN
MRKMHTGVKTIPCYPNSMDIMINRLLSLITF